MESSNLNSTLAVPTVKYDNRTIQQRVSGNNETA